MSELVHKVSRRERWAWYFYDFGNSAYAAVVLLAVYAAYFKGTVVGGAEGSRLWGYSLTIAMLVVAVVAPILGTIADFSGRKKGFLLFFTLLSTVFCGMLFFVQAGDVFIGMLFFILAEIGYRGAQVFYNALLPDVANPEETSHVSGTGWAIGSLGGVLCLFIVLALIMFVGGAFVVRISFVITSLYFLISSIPLFMWLKEKEGAKEMPEGKNYLTLALSRLKHTFSSIRDYKTFLRFIVSFFLYNEGVMMALNFAAIFGAVMYGMDEQGLIILMIILQFTSAAGAWFFGKMATGRGTKIALIASLIVFIADVFAIAFNPSYIWFYVLGGIAGFALTGVQAMSRTMVSLLAPHGRSAEFYGFFAIAGRSSSVIGPAVMGIIAAEGAKFFENQGHTALGAERIGMQLAILSINIFLIAGTIAFALLKNSDILASMANKDN